MFGMIPLPYKLLAGAALILGVFLYGYMKGSAYAEAELQRFAAKASTQVAELEKKNAEISNNVVTEYVDRTNTIREKEYVYVDAAKDSVPSQSVMSNGWVFTHDISASASDADATRSSDASPSGIKDTDALIGIIRNYAICQSNAVQLTELQRWINENKEAVDAMAKEKKKK
jgi:glutamate synthase domain-containing protein 3